MKDWKLLSSHTYGHVYEKENRILKIIPESQVREVDFWKKIVLSESDKQRFIYPDRIEFKKQWKALSLPKNNYYLMEMEKKKETLSKYLEKHKLSLSLERQVFKVMIPVLQLLKAQGFVHADSHLENIMKDKSQFYLIDFGLVMHRDFYTTQQEVKLSELYLWSNDDFFTLCLVLLFHGQEKLRVKNNDYKKYRQRWIRHFTKNPNDWALIKKNVRKTFNFQGHDDFLFCFQFFIKNLLSNSTILSPKPGIQMYDMLTKVFLDRMFLLCAIWYPTHNKLELSTQRQIFYKNLVQKFNF
jgi:serine/threonine protein kinase